MSDELQSFIARDFFKVSEDRYRSIEVKVFICGEAIDTSVSVESLVDVDIRAFLKVRLEQDIPSCRVALAEHKELLLAYKKATGTGSKQNLVNFELDLAHYVDVIILFPCSPGSFAELGMFSWLKHFARRMTIFIKPEYKDVSSFIMLGPVAAALANRSQVQFIDYADRQSILEIVKDEIQHEKKHKGRRSVLAICRRSDILLSQANRTENARRSEPTS